MLNTNMLSSDMHHVYYLAFTQPTLLYILMWNINCYIKLTSDVDNIRKTCVSLRKNVTTMDGADTDEIID